MNKAMNGFIAATVLGVMVLASLPATAQTAIDDFETYKDGQEIGTSYNSMPWRRFGEATNDNVVATRSKAKVISGKLSAQYSVFWPNSFGSAMFGFANPVDASQYHAVSFKMRSNEPATRTRVKLSVTDGTTTYTSSEAVPLTNQAQEFVFLISPDDLVCVDGSGGYDEVLTKTTAVGFQLFSSDGQYLETVIFDDFKFVPKPSEQARK